MHAGLQLSATLTPAVPYVLFTDGDSEHSPDGLRRLVAGAEQGEFDLTSLMVHLQCETLAEWATMPAFVYFFRVLYPFAWVNDPRRSTAAAAGGVMLVRRSALDRIGGPA